MTFCFLFLIIITEQDMTYPRGGQHVRVDMRNDVVDLLHEPELEQLVRFVKHEKLQVLEEMDAGILPQHML